MKDEILKGPYRKAIGKWYASRASAIELVFVIDYIGLDHEGKTQHSGTPIPIFDMITKSADRGVKYSKV